MPPIIENYLAWWIAGLVVVVGLFVYGIRDLVHFSLKRAWAISSVSFAESIRRKVLWITPLAIVGVVLIAQFQHPVDEQDAIRQTTKFCLFASGLVVTVTAIILACTNLPREIESRVIFTIVTKPATRLEIVLGKVIGFARVSAAILVIMGLFSFGYLELRAWSLHKYISARLANGAVDPVSRATLEQYNQNGLLTARQYGRPTQLEIFSRLPMLSDERRFMFGSGEGRFLVPFELDAKDLVSADGTTPSQLSLIANVGFEKSSYAGLYASPTAPPPTSLPYYIQNPTAAAQRTTTITADASQPSISIDIVGPASNSIVDASAINDGKPVAVNDPTGKTPIVIPIPPQSVMQLTRSSLMLVQVSGAGNGWEYFADAKPLMFVTASGKEINPLRDSRRPDGHEFALPQFQSRPGTTGLQLRGGTGAVPVADYSFRGSSVQSVDGHNVRFELHVSVERENEDSADDEATAMEVSVLDRSGNASATPVKVTTTYPESQRASFFDIPLSAIPSGNFDVLMQCKTDKSSLSISGTSLAMVTADEGFAVNLFKSLSIIWLLSVLVVIVSIFCSTFLSWPIAIVLTILILLGHWGVEQLGDATAPGIGNLVVTDLFRGSDPNVARTVSSSVEALSKMLNALSRVLPDITKFSAIEDMEAGVAVPGSRLVDSVQVILLFGVPMTVLAYVLLRQKEVAP